MVTYEIIDAYSTFPNFWKKIQNLSIDQQIQAWADDYMFPWPNLRKKQQQEYANDGYNWKEVTRDFVFPKFPENMQYFTQIGDHLKKFIPKVYNGFQTKFGLNFDMNFVIYVGIGQGAGWATYYEGIPAVLFGVENAAECGWLTQKSLHPLIAHEMGHVIHHAWRRKEDLPCEDHSQNSPLWDLYEEGFAMRMEHLYMGFESWHEQTNQEDWVTWCKENLSELSSLYLKELKSKDPKATQKFFGSWYEVQGMKQTGYFIGHEILKYWEKEIPLFDIAQQPLNLIHENFISILEIFSRDNNH